MRSSNDLTQYSEVKKYLHIAFGAFIAAIAYVFFFEPHSMVPGGIFGWGLLIKAQSFGWIDMFREGLPISVVLLVAIPLCWISYGKSGKENLQRAIYTFVVTALLTDILLYFQKILGIGGIVENDLLLSSIFGSAILGLGMAVILRSQGAYIGTQITARWLSDYLRIPTTYAALLIDFVLVIVSMLWYRDLQLPMYSIFTIMVTRKMVDVFSYGLHLDKAVFIISKHQEEIGKSIISSLNRSATVFYGKGLYEGESKEILYTVVDSSQIGKLKKLVHNVDSNAFITIFDAQEIIGKGFVDNNFLFTKYKE